MNLHSSCTASPRCAGFSEVYMLTVYCYTGLPNVHRDGNGTGPTFLLPLRFKYIVILTKMLAVLSLSCETPRHVFSSKVTLECGSVSCLFSKQGRSCGLGKVLLKHCVFVLKPGDVKSNRSVHRPPAVDDHLVKDRMKT